jgi:hypothetical protein
MINSNMFVGEPTIKDYRNMVLEDILKEYLLFKGTTDSQGLPCNQSVSPRELVSSGLFVYGLKDNPTNRTSIAYYCERQARQNLWMDGNKIMIPKEVWEKCNEINNKYKQTKQ